MSTPEMIAGGLDESLDALQGAAVITHGGMPRSFRICRCSRCGLTRLCTPTTDFYTRPSDGEQGPLYCYVCLMAADSGVRRSE